MGWGGGSRWDSRRSGGASHRPELARTRVITRLSPGVRGAEDHPRQDGTRQELGPQSGHLGGALSPVLKVLRGRELNTAGNGRLTACQRFPQAETALEPRRDGQVEQATWRNGYRCSAFPDSLLYPGLLLEGGFPDSWVEEQVGDVTTGLQVGIRRVVPLSMSSAIAVKSS